MTWTSWAVAAVVIAVAGLLAAVAIADGDGMPHNDQDNYSGMMAAMHEGDSTDMAAHMREVLGEQGFDEMMGHMADHAAGSMMDDSTMDVMMHQMMDGMMQGMMDEMGEMGGNSDHDHRDHFR